MNFDEILAKDLSFSDLDLRLERISDPLTEVSGIPVSMGVPDFLKRTKILALRARAKITSQNWRPDLGKI